MSLSVDYPSVPHSDIIALEYLVKVELGSKHLIFPRGKREHVINVATLSTGKM